MEKLKRLVGKNGEWLGAFDISGEPMVTIDGVTQPLEFVAPLVYASLELHDPTVIEELRNEELEQTQSAGYLEQYLAGDCQEQE